MSVLTVTYLLLALVVLSILLLRVIVLFTFWPRALLFVINGSSIRLCVGDVLRVLRVVGDFILMFGIDTAGLSFDSVMNTLGFLSVGVLCFFVLAL